MLLGLGLIALGFLAMSGGGSDDPKVFNPDIFSFRRISLAPPSVLFGFSTTVKKTNGLTTVNYHRYCGGAYRVFANFLHGSYDLHS